MEIATAKELQPGLFRIKVPLPESPLKFLNSYAIRSASRNLVIDTGLNRSVFFNRPDAEIIEAWTGWEPMIACAARNGFPEAELRRAIEEHPGFKFGSEWAPELSILKDGDIIEVGGYGFRCVHTPGHTLGHTCLYEPEKKLLVAGDHILVDITPNIQCWSETEDPLRSYLESLDRVHALDVALTLPGHRRLIADHRGRIDELKEHHRRRCDEVLEILSNGALTAWDVAARMRWDIRCERWEDFPLAQKWFATGEAISHLRYLETGGRVKRRLKENLLLYQSDAGGDGRRLRA